MKHARINTLAGLWLFPVILLLATGCAWLGLDRLVATKIVVKGSKRTLREQVLGAYGELEEEVYVLASVRSIDPVSGKPSPPPKMTESRRSALDARRSMEFNRDDVFQFKREGYVGEAASGLLVIMPDAKVRLEKDDPWLFVLVRDVVAEENADRRNVMKRIIEITPELQGEGGMDTLKMILAEKHRQEAEPGMKIQSPDGKWVTKQKREGGD
jgi:uncharacterized protein YdbL (DUF1318 family)